MGVLRLCLKKVHVNRFRSVSPKNLGRCAETSVFARPLVARTSRSAGILLHRRIPTCASTASAAISTEQLPTHFSTGRADPGDWQADQKHFQHSRESGRISLSDLRLCRCGHGYKIAFPAADSFYTHIGSSFLPSKNNFEITVTNGTLQG